MNNSIIYDKVNQTILAELEKGIIPWRKPWKVEFPVNIASGKEYQGFNWWMLMYSQEKMKYTSNIWGTFKQITSKGGSVKRGEHSVPVIFWKMLEVGEKKNKKTGKMEAEIVPMLRYYNVFNIDQTEGINVKEFVKTENIVTSAEKLIDTYSAKEVKITYGGSQAYYSPITDYINLPERRLFYDDNEFYAAAFHEMTHSTGHKSRLNRFKEEEKYNHTFGSADYSKEELTAEFGASYLCAKTKILPNTLKNSTAYLQGWLSALENDKSLLVSAAGKAQKASDFILNVK